MSGVLVYTFRTNTHLGELEQIGIDVFVFGKLKKDFANFQILIDSIKPKHVIGLAEVDTQSRIEKLAINAFGPKRKINKNGKDSYTLHTPTVAHFPKSKTPTRSFCNWTMYKISEVINPKFTTVSFVHFNQMDLPKVIDFVKKINTK